MERCRSVEGARDPGEWSKLDAVAAGEMMQAMDKQTESGTQRRRHSSPDKGIDLQGLFSGLQINPDAENGGCD